jgi:hypothetical protein
MSFEALALLSVAVLAIAVLYSSVGHAGASGYIAVMALVGLAPEEIKPVALTLNILVASITSYQFWRAGHFSFGTFWPFALLAVPFAFLGGYLNLPVQLFKTLVGFVLLFSAAQFIFRPPAEGETVAPAAATALPIGAALGLLSGLTGTGGGIFLTPLLIFMHWARTRTAAAVSALFILLNSGAGLLGNFSATRDYPAFAIVLAACAVVGGTLGSWMGSRRLQPMVIKRLLAVVLIIAGFKLIFA